MLPNVAFAFQGILTVLGHGSAHADRMQYILLKVQTELLQMQK